jgi:hypothetical protein
MPPLPGTSRVRDDILEEPYALGHVRGGSFSPGAAPMRNSPPRSTPNMTPTSTPVTQMSGVTGTPATSARETLLRIYTEKASSHVLTKYDNTNIAEVTKLHILGRIKFVLPDRKFTSFWQPDLLTNTPPYVDAFFDSYGYRFSNRKQDDAVLEQAAELWKAAAPRIKKIVDNHRSSVAQKMKSDIMKGRTIE